MSKIAMVVETDEQLHAIYEVALETVGFDGVFRKNCVEEALSTFEANADAIDLIILELILPMTIADRDIYIPVRDQRKSLCASWLNVPYSGEGNSKFNRILWELAALQEEELGLLGLEGGTALLEGCARITGSPRLHKPVLVHTFRNNPDVIRRCLASIDPATRRYAEKACEGITVEMLIGLIRDLGPI